MKNKTNFMTKTWVIVVGAMICCTLWGSAFPCIKIGYRMLEIAAADTASQILYAGYRFTLAGVLTIVLGSILQRKILLPKRSSIGKIGLLSLLQTVLQYLFFYIGLAHTTGVKASIIEVVSTFVAILVAGYLFHQETVTSRKMLGCLIGFAGVVLVNVAGSGMDFHFSPAGDGLHFAVNRCLCVFLRLHEAVFAKRRPCHAERVSVYTGWHCYDCLRGRNGRAFESLYRECGGAAHLYGNDLRGGVFSLGHAS